MKWKSTSGTEQIDEAEKERDKSIWDQPFQFSETYEPRMSPFSKEILYREYQKGMTIKDLSLKYGILQQRVKAIVY